MLSNWLSVVVICCLGAMSPGPSLAVVVKNTLAGNRTIGLLTALGHGLGIGLYAMLCITGLVFLVTRSEVLFIGLQAFGAAYLIWIAYKSLTASSAVSENSDHKHFSLSPSEGFRSGFLIAFLNPKIALFFIALFSQLISPSSPLLEKVLYASTAATIDTLWYALVAVAFSHSMWLDKLKRNAVWLDRFFGVLLLLLAGKLIYGLLT